MYITFSVICEDISATLCKVAKPSCNLEQVQVECPKTCNACLKNYGELNFQHALWRFKTYCLF